MNSRTYLQLIALMPSGYRLALGISRRAIVATFCCALLAQLACAQATSKIPAGFTPIFDGKTTGGWHWSRTVHHGTTAKASVVGGELILAQHPYGQGGLLLTDKSYRDFELYLEARPDETANGGIFVRSTESGAAYQVELVRPGNTGAWIGEGVTLTNPKYLAAGPDIDDVWKDGEWNSLRLRMVGENPHVTLWINEVKMWEVQMPMNDQIAGTYGGMIGLQLHWTAAYSAAAQATVGGGKAGLVQRFRNIAIRELN